MSVIAETIALLERELAGLDDKRGQIDQALSALRSLAREGVTPVGRPVGTVRRPSTTAPRMARRDKVKERGGSRTGDTAGVISNHRGRSNTVVTERILAVLRTSGGPVSPQALRQAVGGSALSIRQCLTDLAKQGSVVVTGATTARRVTLAASQAKQRPRDHKPASQSAQASPADATRAVRRLDDARLSVAPASPDVVRARDAAILEALSIRPRSSESLLEVLPPEPGLTPEQKQAALSSALIRLRVKRQVDLVEGTWRRL